MRTFRTQGMLSKSSGPKTEKMVKPLVVEGPGVGVRQSLSQRGGRLKRRRRLRFANRLKGVQRHVPRATVRRGLKIAMVFKDNQLNSIPKGQSGQMRRQFLHAAALVVRQLSLAAHLKPLPQSPSASRARMTASLTRKASISKSSVLVSSS